MPGFRYTEDQGASRVSPKSSESKTMLIHDFHIKLSPQATATEIAAIQEALGRYLEKNRSERNWLKFHNARLAFFFTTFMLYFDTQAVALAPGVGELLAVSSGVASALIATSIAGFLARPRCYLNGQKIAPDEVRRQLEERRCELERAQFASDRAA